jgi:hypothetical protein
MKVKKFGAKKVGKWPARKCDRGRQQGTTAEGWVAVSLLFGSISSIAAGPLFRDARGRGIVRNWTEKERRCCSPDRP